VDPLNLAIQAHQANNLSVAEALYKKHLLISPGDANAKQLLGLVYCAGQKFDLARLVLEESLQINPNQPHVQTNLGICLQRLGKYTQAVQCFIASIQLDADYIEAYKNLALIYQSAGELSSALDIIANGLSHNKNNLQLLKLQAVIANDVKDYPLAISALRNVLKIQPEAITSRHNLGVSLRLNGQSKEALEHYLILEKNNVSNYQLKHNIGNAYSDLAQLEKAIKYFKQALELNIGYVESHKNLNNLLWELDYQQEYLSSYKKAMNAQPQNKELHFSYAKSLLLTSHYQEAINFLNQLSEQFKQCAEYFDLCGLALLRLGYKKEALIVQKQAVSYEPVNAEYLNNYARNLIESGDVTSAVPHLEKILELDPDDQMAIAYLAVCWRILHDPRETDINNYDELVKEYQLGAIGNFEDIQSFCAALKLYLDTLHTAKKQPLEQTLMHGTQTKGNLFDNKNELIQLLVKEITRCVDDYDRQVRKVSHINPDLKELDQFYFSGSFSIVLKEKGFHVSHVHPMGRLSLCFYVDVPDIVAEDVGKQGWLHLGEPNLDLQPKLEAERFVQPTVGKLLIFPSFMWHGTRAFETEESRTTVVCDIMPSKKANCVSVHN
jgi:tetratricopeptide (TPR) repeat protein